LATSTTFSGQSHEVHLVVNDNDEWQIKKIIKGDTVNTVLKMHQFDRRELLDNVELRVRDAREKGKISEKEAANILNTMKKEIIDYTYLDF